jgi:hypothetical protein
MYQQSIRQIMVYWSWQWPWLRWHVESYRSRPEEYERPGGVSLRLRIYRRAVAVGGGHWVNWDGDIYGEPGESRRALLQIEQEGDERPH